MKRLWLKYPTMLVFGLDLLQEFNELRSYGPLP